MAIWLLKLDRNPAAIERCRALLSPDEHQRAARLRPLDLRGDFIVTRGVLRQILAEFVGQDLSASELRFACGEHGKPRLIEAQGGDRTTFNVSHTANLSVIAVARERLVGIDAERIRTGISYEGIAKRWFSREENAMLQRLAGPERLRGFFTAWSRKEAFVKATGTGISRPMNHFVVSVSPREPASILDSPRDAGTSRGWAIFDLPLPEGYVGAVVGQGTDWIPVFREWRHE